MNDQKTLADVACGRCGAENPGYYRACFDCGWAIDANPSESSAAAASRSCVGAVTLIIVTVVFVGGLVLSFLILQSGLAAAQWPFVVFASVWVAAGIVAFFVVWRRTRYQRLRRRRRRSPTSDTVVQWGWPLPPADEYLGPWGCLLITAAWNGVTWALVFAGRVEGVLSWLMIVPFVAVGLLLVVLLVHNTLERLHFGPPVLMAKKRRQAPGETLEFRFERRCRRAVQRARASISAREKSRCRTDSDTKEVERSQTIDTLELEFGVERGSEVLSAEGAFHIPESAMHSYISPNHRLQYVVEIELESGSSVVSAEFQVTVVPASCLSR